MLSRIHSDPLTITHNHSQSLTITHDHSWSLMITQNHTCIFPKIHSDPLRSTQRHPKTPKDTQRHSESLGKFYRTVWIHFWLLWLYLDGRCSLLTWVERWISTSDSFWTHTNSFIGSVGIWCLKVLFLFFMLEEVMPCILKAFLTPFFPLPWTFTLHMTLERTRLFPVCPPLAQGCTRVVLTVHT